MEFQTRNDIGELRFFATFAAAYAHYKADPSVWKISWDDKNRWRAKHRCDLWLPESEEKLKEISKTYANEPVNADKIFWVQQLILPDNYMEIMSRRDLSPGRKEMLSRLESIKTVLTDDAFTSKFMDLGRAAQM